MKDSIKDDLQYLLLSALIILMLALVGGLFLFAWDHMNPKDREDILIIMFMSNQ